VRRHEHVSDVSLDVTTDRIVVLGSLTLGLEAVEMSREGTGVAATMAVGGAGRDDDLNDVTSDGIVHGGVVCSAIYRSSWSCELCPKSI